MPIVFEQPQPLRGDISQGYGAAEQWSRDFPMLQRQQQGIADAYLQSASMRQHAAQQSAALQAQAQMHAASLDQQSYMGEQQAAMARQQMAHQSDMQSQHAQLQDQLAQNQLSRGEQMRLQRLQEARGLVQEQVNSGTLTAEEGQAALMQIQTGIDPLQRRQQQFQRQVQEFQFHQMQTQAARQDQLWEERQQFHNQGFANRVSAFVGDDGEARRVVMGENGAVDWHATQLLFGHQYGGGEHAASPRGGASGGQAGGEGSAVGAASGTRGGPPPGTPWHQLPVATQNHIYEHEIAQMRREQAAETLTGDRRPVWQTDPAAFDRELASRIQRRLQVYGQGSPPAGQMTDEQRASVTDQQARRDAERQWSLQNREALHNGRMTYEQFQRQRQAAGQLAVVGSQLRRQNQPTASPLRQHETNDEREAASSQPFTQEEIGRLPPAQQVAANSLNTFRRLLAEPNIRAEGRALTAAQREELTADLNRMQELASRYGSERAMPPGEQSRYAYYQRRLNRLEVPRPPQSATPTQQQGAPVGFSQGVLARTQQSPARVDPVRRWLDQQVGNFGLPIERLNPNE